MTATAPDRAPRGSSGLRWGLVAGVAVWAVYFLQATVLDGPFWDVFVVPILGVLAAGALVAAWLSPPRRSWWLGFAGGVIVMLPLALAAFLVLFAVLGLE